jgi:hypothetical protein
MSRGADRAATERADLVAMSLPGTHPLLRGGRWHLARPQTRALWTSATRAELAQLVDDPALRRSLERLLREATAALDDVDALLLFDERCVDLELVVSVRGEACSWSWA